jgi:hypothetical protein
MAIERDIKIKQDEEKPIPLEILATSIIEFEKATRRMASAGLTDRAIALLLQDAIPGNMSILAIMATLKYLPKLADIYLRRQPKAGRK